MTLVAEARQPGGAANSAVLPQKCETNIHDSWQSSLWEFRDRSLLLEVAARRNRISASSVLTLALLAFALGPGGLARAADIHVPADRSTIQGAIVAAAAGDVIIVAPGVYPELINFLGKAIELRSSGGPAVTTIDGSAFTESVVRCVSGEGPDSILRGFTISGGTAVLGGGMYNYGSSPTVIDCIFSGNNASDRGGGMHNLLSSPTVLDSTFINNVATAMGGGMYNEQSTTTISRCIFETNTSTKGGGIRNYIDGHITISDSIFSHNVALEEGGGLDNRKNSNANVTRTVFIGNTAASGGGAIHNYVGNAVATGNPVVTSSIFIGNSAPEGGAMRNNDPNPVITNCTFVGNSSGILSRNGSVPIISNSIFWGNTGETFLGDSTPIVTFSTIEGGFPGTGNISTDPQFLDPNGPDGDPATPEDGDYHLMLNSPSIDVGDNAAMSLPEKDLDGIGRIVNGTVDMGAYESVLCTSSSQCDDLDLCTVDVCSANICTNDPIVCSPGDVCTAGVCEPICDDGVGCTDDTCDGAGNVILSVPNDAACDNGLFCDGSEICDPVLDCQPGTAPSIDDGVTCTDDSCDEAGNQIVHVTNDGSCSNGLFCDGSETCDLVLDCQPGTAPAIDDGVACTDDSCDEAGDQILHATNDGSCSNGLFCDGSEICDLVLDCQPGTAPSIDDGVSCTDDSCDEAGDQILHVVNDGSCSNGLFCDGSETCDLVLDCQPGTAPSIDDGVSCTDDSCDEAGDQILHAVNDGSCSNGLFCDGSETCDLVLDCQAGIAPSIDDGVTCTDDSCDEIGDQILHATNDGSCSNGLFCDGSETCDLVLDCQPGTAPSIDDGVWCTDDSCDEDSDEILNAANDESCDDGDECTAESCDEIWGCLSEEIPQCGGIPVPAMQPLWMLVLVVAFVLVGAPVARHGRR
ncbi:MAG: hypothetical protein IH881_16625 [Myxococcales bacterium]|nr:hypothetical protein [Myxococcales bacterium]